jgi:hypothetical protein
VHKQAFRVRLREYCASIGVDPHYYMADMIADTEEVVLGVSDTGLVIMGPKIKPSEKLKAATELAQYIEPKLKSVDMELSGNQARPIIVSIRRG